ncbi:MAG TPA: class I SAM-dependent methyltransferase [Steroidobacteraceae bacterium]|nr:class I SAM-dependent methyltransferase [Steroidobacteraceae bacterium]
MNQPAPLPLSLAELESAGERIARHCVCCASPHLLASPAVLMPFVAHRTFGWEPVVIDESWGLQTIPSGRAYSICNTLCCSACGLVFLDLRFSAEELGRLYEGYREAAYNTLRERYEPGYTLRNDALNEGIDYLDKVEAFLAPHVPERPAVLDWGGDTGRNTPFKGRSSVFDVFDISSKPVVAGARAVGRELVRASRYDLIVLSNVLEHVPFPAGPLREIRHSMHAGSVLYVEVPFEDIMRAGEPSTRKKHWHEHVNFFSRQSLLELLRATGYEVLAIGELAVYSGRKSAWLLQLACRPA